MAITKESKVDKIESLETGNLQVRTATKIIEDGVTISTTYSREVLNPGQDVSGMDAKVIAIANATWTDEVIAAYAEAHPILIGTERAEAGSGVTQD